MRLAQDASYRSKTDHLVFENLRRKSKSHFDFLHFTMASPIGVTTGTGAVASRRGIDLGPTRLHMPSGLLRRIQARGMTSDMVQRTDIAAGSPVRYGSGARLHSRERDQ